MTDLPMVLAAIAQLRELAAGIPPEALQTITEFIAEKAHGERPSQERMWQLGAELAKATRPEELLRLVTEAARDHLDACRVLVYRLLGEGRGRVQMETVRPDLAATQGMMMPLAAWGVASTLGWQLGTVMATGDRRELLLTDYQQQVMEHLQILAQVVVPIFVPPSPAPWGLLIVHQGDRPRSWSAAEIDFLQWLAREVSLFLLPLELRRQSDRVRQQEELLTEHMVALARGKDGQASYAALAGAIQRFLSVGRVAIWLDAPPELPRYVAIAPPTADALGVLPPPPRMLSQGLFFEDVRSPDCGWTDRECQQLLAAEAIASASVPFGSGAGRGVLWVRHHQPRRWQPLDVCLVQQGAAQCGLMARGTMGIGDPQQTALALEMLLDARQDLGEVALHLQKIHGLSKKMGRLTQLLDGFTTQTNLLALNAALESTRIGELGRSFTVVTDEVRLLAKQSGTALEELNQHLTELLQTSASSLAIANHGMAEIVASLAHLRDQPNEVPPPPDRERKAL
jgi:methyl-accepting chemotaxis protein PixJ